MCYYKSYCDTMSTTQEPSSSDPPSADLSSSEPTVIADRLTGTVKWFNNKAGYGFITVCDGEFATKDIFVHYSSIRVSNSQYKYLVQGEYVDFTLVKSENDVHEYQATNVSGVKGGPIMCETRRTLSTPAPPQGSRTYRPRDSDDSARYEQRRRPVSRTDDSEGYTRVERNPVSRTDNSEGYTRVERHPVSRTDNSEGYTRVERNRPPRDSQPTVSRGGSRRAPAPKA